MAKLYTLSPLCPENPVLFPTIRPTFIAAGHGFTDNPQEADCFLIDLHTRLFDYDKSVLEYVLSSNKPICTWDEFDKGGMSFEDWPNPLTSQQIDIFVHIMRNEILSVHFCRLLNKTKTNYPSHLYPYEKPYAYEEPILTADELFGRPYDVCLIANSSPQREAIAAALRSDKRLKCIIKLGEPKLPFDEFLALHKKGKFFISSAAGGYTDERVQCLFSIAGIIRQRTDQLVSNDFTHRINCLRIDSPPTKDDIDLIAEAANNKQRLYDIYTNGYNFVKQYWSAEAMGKRYLEILTKEGIL